MSAWTDHIIDSRPIKDIFDDTRSITEPAGALGVAGIKKYVEQRGVRGQTLVAIDSGANVNFDRLRHVAERAELGEGREAIIAVTIPEVPGSFKAFCQAVGVDVADETPCAAPLPRESPSDAQSLLVPLPVSGPHRDNHPRSQGRHLSISSPRSGH